MAERPKESGASDAEDQYIVFQGSFCPQVRASDSTTGESVAGVLDTCMQPAKLLQDHYKDLFGTAIRVTEFDSAMANDRGARMFAVGMGQWQHITVHCAPHRLHSASVKTLALCPDWLRGTIRSLLVCQQSQQLSLLRRSLEHLIEQRCVLRLRAECQVSVEGRQYRRNLLRCFLPSLRTPRKKCRVVLFCTFLLNGDWREQKQLIHICKGSSCCPRGVESTKEKLRAWLPALLRTLRPSQLNRGNWMNWSNPLVFLGLLQGMHGLLADMYRYAFSVPALACRSPGATVPCCHSSDYSVTIY